MTTQTTMDRQRDEARLLSDDQLSAAKRSLTSLLWAARGEKDELAAARLSETLRAVEAEATSRARLQLGRL